MQSKSRVLVPLSIVLSDRPIDEKSMARLRERFERLGITVSAVGRATISGRVSMRDFKRLFGVVAEQVGSEPPGTEDMGSPGGFRCESELTVPAELAPCVRHIAVEPPYRRLK